MKIFLLFFHSFILILCIFCQAPHLQSITSNLFSVIYFNFSLSSIFSFKFLVLHQKNYIPQTHHFLLQNHQHLQNLLIFYMSFSFFQMLTHLLHSYFYFSSDFLIFFKLYSKQEVLPNLFLYDPKYHPHHEQINIIILDLDRIYFFHWLYKDVFYREHV